jgi:hypothetical protein
MIKLPAPFINNMKDYLVYSERIPTDNNRPALVLKSSTTGYFYWYKLTDELHMWMVENKVKYTLDSEPAEGIKSHMLRFNKWFIIFENENDAVLYKLSWL